MRFRNELSYLMISLSSFQSFDHDEEIKERIPDGWNLLTGDRIPWERAQFDGIAEVVACEVVEGHQILYNKKDQLIY